MPADDRSAKPRSPIRRVQRLVKRGFDIVVSVTCLLLASPLFLLFSALIRATMGRPILFRQERLGLHGQPFVLLKFRTMRDDRDDRGRLLSDEERLTRLGRFLRGTTLDELPELINVLRGELSVVGPRPLLPEYRARYTLEQWRRHEMPPGMAGPVVSKGRNALTWSQKLDLDVWYVDHWSLRKDVKILFTSIWKVLKREGISADGHATMPPFEGTVEHREDGGRP